MRVSVRMPPHVVPRQVLGVPARSSARRSSVCRPPSATGPRRRSPGPSWATSAATGCPRPTDGVARDTARGGCPVLDVGFARSLKAGRIAILPPVESLTEREALLVGGGRARVDVIVAATGYTPGLEPLVGAPSASST